MTIKAKCSVCNQRDVFAKGMCSGCYGKAWREQRKVERARVVEEVQPRQLTTGDVIEGEIVHDEQVKVPETHLVATSPVEMAASREGLRAWLESKLTVLERDIIEANAALNEARQNNWATGALTSARNRAVDDETYYNKILAAVEAGHTIIPDFPIQVFAVRRSEADKAKQLKWSDTSGVDVNNQWLAELRAPVQADCSPVGAGEYRNPGAQVTTWKGFQVKGVYPFFARRTGRPVGPISFPSMTARSPVMRATAVAMHDKVFDQIGVCLPTVAVAASRQVQQGARAGDPLVIGQVVHKRVGGKQKVTSFIIAWYLNLDEL
jgi:hypothetical protein